jgi:iron complex transport system permease protein
MMLLVAACSVLLALDMGSMDIGVVQVFHALYRDGHTLAGRVVHELRLPRVLGGFVVGGMLALAGALMQVLLRNPLAEPYVLGVSGGASVFALLAMLAGLAGIWVNLAAFTGAFLSMLLVFVLAQFYATWELAGREATITRLERSIDELARTLSLGPRQVLRQAEVRVRLA